MTEYYTLGPGEIIILQYEFIQVRYLLGIDRTSYLRVFCDRYHTQLINGIPRISNPENIINLPPNHIDISFIKLL